MNIGRVWRRQLVVGVGTAALILGMAGPAGAALATPPDATIALTPAFGLVNGEGVTVTGSGMTPNQNGALLECNNDPNQPTVAFLGIPVPVGCSDIFGQSQFPVSVSTLVNTSPTGTFAGQFVIRTGVLGPPTSGTDSAGNDAGADAANYPCPPTPAQREAGDACRIVFGDLANESVSEDIGFGTPIHATPSVITDSGYEAGGMPIEVRVSGLAPDSPTIVEECNLTPGEPPNPFFASPATGCTAPLSTGTDPFVPVTDSTGSLDTTLTLVEGNIGETAQSAAYPCPPTAANVALGGSCDVFVEDSGLNTAQGYLGLEGPLPVPTLSVTPDLGLLNGQQVTANGSGFTPGNEALVFECNQTRGEPTVGVYGTQVPVGCSDPFEGSLFENGFGFTNPDGTLTAQLTIATGILGPPQPEYEGFTVPDSAGNDAASDAAKYPCPPTRAQQAAGANCSVTVIDTAGAMASTPISFGSAKPQSPEIQVLALAGSLDPEAIPDGTEVIVAGSGFTADSPLQIFECAFTPGAQIDPLDGLPFDCQTIESSGSFLTDSGGGLSAIATVESFTDFFNYPPTPTPCDADPTPATGTCAVVVIDGAGEQAQATIGVTGPLEALRPPPEYDGPTEYDGA